MRRHTHTRKQTRSSATIADPRETIESRFWPARFSPASRSTAMGLMRPRLLPARRIRSPPTHYHRTRCIVIWEMRNHEHSVHERDSRKACSKEKASTPAASQTLTADGAAGRAAPGRGRGARGIARRPRLCRRERQRPGHAPAGDAPCAPRSSVRPCSRAPPLSRSGAWWRAPRPGRTRAGPRQHQSRACVPRV